MSLLPGRHTPLPQNQTRFVGQFQTGFASKLIALAIFTLLTLTLTTPAFAQPATPDPQPCQDALFTNQYTKVVAEPFEFQFKRSATKKTKVSIRETIKIPIDFSALAAIFAAPNSDYLESEFQDQDHRGANILNFSSTEFNTYHGPGQKAAPKVMVDQLKQKYVQYIAGKPQLAESANAFANIDGQNPKTVQELVAAFDQPLPPSLGGNQDIWATTWSRYWEKIPTAVNEFYWGKFIFPLVAHNYNIEKIENGGCPPKSRVIYFVLPEYFRTTSITNQINQILVPSTVQSAQHNFLDQNLFSSRPQANPPQGTLAKVIDFCLKFIPTPLAETLRKVIKVGFDWLNPLKTVYAINIRPDDQWPLPEQCPATIPIPANQKTGSGPFCSLPLLTPHDPAIPQAFWDKPQLEGAESCQDNNDPNKLDSGQQVVCTFITVFDNQGQPLEIGRVENDIASFDYCQEPTDKEGESTGLFECTINVQVYPIFYIPWLASTWNNSLYSDEKAKGVFGNPQESGRPGLYTYFLPRATAESILPDLSLASQEEGGQIKQRFMGAVDCAKEFTRDIALKPKALQEALGIKQHCKTNL